MSFSFDSSKILSPINIVVCDTVIASINIFNKQLVLNDKVFYEEVEKAIEEKAKELEKKYKKYDKQITKFNNPSFKKNKNESTKIAILNATIMKKKATIQKKFELEEAHYEILELEAEYNDLINLRNSILKDMEGVRHLQNRLKDRVVSKLNYSVVIN
jgi:hypothetical protein